MGVNWYYGIEVLNNDKINKAARWDPKYVYRSETLKRRCFVSMGDYLELSGVKEESPQSKSSSYLRS